MFMSQSLRPLKLQRDGIAGKVADPFQKFSEQDAIALHRMFEGFDMSEIECDLHRVCEAIVPFAEDWFDLMA